MCQAARELRQNFLDAKRDVLKSDFSGKNDGFAFDINVAKHLKSKFKSTSEIIGTLAQSDHVHNLLKHHRHDLLDYRKRLAQYIF